MTDYQPIKCTDYDQYEAYCIAKAKLTISTFDGESVTGHATDLKYIKNQGEFLVLAPLNVQQSEQHIRLDKIKQVVAV